MICLLATDPSPSIVLHGFHVLSWITKIHCASERLRVGYKEIVSPSVYHKAVWLDLDSLRFIFFYENSLNVLSSFFLKIQDETVEVEQDFSFRVARGYSIQRSILPFLFSFRCLRKIYCKQKSHHLDLGALTCGHGCPLAAAHCRLSMALGAGSCFISWCAAHACTDLCGRTKWSENEKLCRKSLQEKAVHENLYFSDMSRILKASHFLVFDTWSVDLAFPNSEFDSTALDLKT